MANHKAEAVIVTCIDFRLQEYIDKWISKNFKPGTFDRVALGGGVKNIDVILDQVKISNDLHHINQVIYINHEDCGAYGTESTREKHSHDLKKAKAKIKASYPNLEVKAYYLHLNGEFELIP